MIDKQSRKLGRVAQCCKDAPEPHLFRQIDYALDAVVESKPNMIRIQSTRFRYVA